MMNLFRNEKGFSLLELLLVLGIMGAIGGAMTMTTATIVKITPESNEHIIALRQAQNAGYWITRDAQTAQTVTTDPGTGFLELTSTVFSGGAYVDVTILYQLDTMPDMPATIKRLMRTSNGVPMMVAEYIYYDPVGNPDATKVEYDSASKKLSFWVTAKAGNVALAQKKYEATQRVPGTP